MLIDLNPDELLYYPYMVSLDRCNGTCNTLHDLSDKSCVPDKSQDVNVKVFNLTTRICESK